MQTIAREALFNSLRWLQSSEEYSDLKIFCGDEVFKVHKAIVCPRSKYFETSCKWGKDDKPKEEITLTDEDPRLVQLMVDYLYQLDYDDLIPVKALEEEADGVPEPESPVATNIKYFEDLGQEDVPQVQPEDERRLENIRNEDTWDFQFSQRATPKKNKKGKTVKKPRTKPQLKEYNGNMETNRLTINTLMYALADKYAIEDLKALARTKFQEAAREDWQSKAFVHAANLAFETTPSLDKGLRNVVIETINQHRELVDYDEVQELLDSGNGMAWALVQVLLESSRSVDGF